MYQSLVKNATSPLTLPEELSCFLRLMEVQNNYVHPSEKVSCDTIGLLVSVNQTAKGFSYLKLKESAVASINRSDWTILPMNMNEVHLVIY